MDLLIDTNVLLDHFGDRPGYAENANKVLALGLFHDARLWAAPQSFNDMFYILHKVVPAEAVQKAFARAYKVINVCSVDAADMALAAERSWPDMEDCLIAICAEKIHARYLVTRDERGFASSAVEPISPEALLSVFEKERGLVYDWLPSF